MSLARHNDICNKQIACDGTSLRGNRRMTGVCTACEEAINKRGKKIAPRGINYHDNLSVAEVQKVRGARPWAE